MTIARLFDGQSAADRPVRVSIQDGDLRLAETSGVTVATWPMTSLQRSDNYSPEEGATIKRRGGDERLVIPDEKFLDELRRAGARIAGGGKPWTASRWSGWIAVATLVLGGLVLLVDQAPAWIAPFVPRSVEASWSSEIEDLIVGTDSPCVAAPGRAALERLMDRLAKSAGLTPTPHVAVAETRMVNAFTLPDGRIVIFSGLIADAHDPDELAGVIAHELGHALHHDPTREAVRRFTLSFLTQGLSWTGGLAGNLTALSYGRRAEAAADASALVTLKGAGIRADGLARFFTRLMGKNDGSPFPSFLSDHPSTASRIEALRVEPVGEAAMDDAQWRAVRAICVKPARTGAT